MLVKEILLRVSVSKASLTLESLPSQGSSSQIHRMFQMIRHSQLFCPTFFIHHNMSVIFVQSVASFFSSFSSLVNWLLIIPFYLTYWLIIHILYSCIIFLVVSLEFWTGWPIPSPVGLPDPGIKLVSPALQADSLPTELSGKLRIFNIYP